MPGHRWVFLRRFPMDCGPQVHSRSQPCPVHSVSTALLLDLNTVLQALRCGCEAGGHDVLGHRALPRGLRGALGALHRDLRKRNADVPLPMDRDQTGEFTDSRAACIFGLEFSCSCSAQSFIGRSNVSSSRCWIFQ